MRRRFFKHVDYDVQDIVAETTAVGRWYVTPEGSRYQSVTTALGEYFDTETKLQEWRKRVGEDNAKRISRTATSRGQRFHDLLELYLKNEDSSVPLNIKEIFDATVDKLDILINTVHMLEAPLYSDKYRLAGRVDCICTTGADDHLTVIDFKTSAKEKKRSWIESYFLQCAAYAFMFEERYGKPINDCKIVMGCLDAGKCEVFHEDVQKYRDHDFFRSRELCSDTLSSTQSISS